MKRHWMQNQEKKSPIYLTSLNEEFRYMKLRQVVTVPTEITLQLLLHKYAI